MKLKPFNLEAALRGEPVVAKSGRWVAGIYHLSKAGYQFRVAVVFEEGSMPQFFTEEGKAGPMGEPCLFMAPKKVTKWGRLMRNKEGTMLYTANLVHDTKEEAEREPIPPLSYLVTTFPIEFEE